MFDLDSNLESQSNSFIGELIQLVNPNLEYSCRMEWFERIVHLRQQMPGDKKNGWSRAELARRAGVSYDILNKYERGDINQPNEEILGKIAKAFGTTTVALRYGSDLDDTLPQATGSVVSLDIAGEVAAGLWLEADVAAEEAVQPSNFRPCSDFPAKAQYLLKVRGESLNKVAQDGDLLLCVNYFAAAIEPMVGDLAIVERSSDGGDTIERTAKRIVKMNGRVELMPESNDPKFQTPVVYDDNDEEFSRVQAKAKVLYAIRAF